MIRLNASVNFYLMQQLYTQIVCLYVTFIKATPRHAHRTNPTCFLFYLYIQTLTFTPSQNIVCNFKWCSRCGCVLCYWPQLLYGQWQLLHHTKDVIFPRENGSLMNPPPTLFTMLQGTVLLLARDLIA